MTRPFFQKRERRQEQDNRFSPAPPYTVGERDRATPHVPAAVDVRALAGRRTQHPPPVTSEMSTRASSSTWPSGMREALGTLAGDEPLDNLYGRTQCHGRTVARERANQLTSETESEMALPWW